MSVLDSQPGNLGASLAGLLGHLGIAPSSDRDDATCTAEAVLAARGLDASVVELRWGVLFLEADPRTATYLRYDRDALLAELSARAPGVVNDVQVRTRR